MWIICKQTIAMKYQDLLSMKKKKKLQCHLLQILLGALRANYLISINENIMKLLFCPLDMC